MAERGTLYEDAYSQGNESAYSHATLFTGRYPSEIAAPVYETYAVPEDAEMLPEILKIYGYRTLPWRASVGAFARPLSEFVMVQGEEVQQWGYTDPQLDALGHLARELARLLPSIPPTVPAEVQGERRAVLDGRASLRGFVGHLQRQPARLESLGHAADL